jgi:hypothetical protein
MIDTEKLSQLRNAVMNLGESSNQDAWERTRRLLDELYKERFEPVKQELIEFPYFEAGRDVGFAETMADFNNLVVKSGKAE